MAINIANKQNVTPAAGDFEFAKIKDETTPGANDGVPINDNVYGDFHQFFAKIIEQAGITYNDLPENLTNGYQYLEALKKLFVQTVPGDQLKTSIINIGDWDMDTDETVTVAHGLSDHKKIKGINVIIRDDDDAGYHDLSRQVSGEIAGGVVIVNSTNIIIGRITGRGFDNALFDSTSFNRGSVKFECEL